LIFFEGTSSLAKKIEQNTIRYLNIIYEAIDKVMPTEKIQITNETDTMDIIIEHRKEAKNKQIIELEELDETDTLDLKNPIPKSLLRR
jgi:hypothetical protein